MKQILCILVTLFLSLQLNAEVPLYQNKHISIEKRAEDLCRRMTIEEKALFLSGKDLWHFKGIDRLGVPELQVTDCGHGITVVFDKQGNWVGNATCFPTAVLQASTWNRALVYEVGGAIAREARATGSSILLAPMINIKRTPLGGRNYEVFSEDPILTGEIAATFINGVQSEKIGAVVKSFAVNNQQAQQENLMVYATEPTLQEIYLPGFKIAIAKSNPWGVMTAYNGLNGSRTSASEYLLKNILRDQWKYKGFVVSDWRAVHGVESIWNGCDIEMPGPGKFMTKDNVLNAITQGKLTTKELNEKIKRILGAYLKSTLLDSEKSTLSAEINTERHQKLTLKVAEEGIVLLKNQNNLLPLNFKKIKKLAVIGPNAEIARLGGGGSASVSPFYSVSPLQGIKNVCDKSTEITYKEGCGLNGNLTVIDINHLTCLVGGKRQSGLKAEYFTNSSLDGVPALTTIDEQINFSWGWANPKPQISRNGYSVRWSGKLVPPVTGNYKLGISAGECGYRLYINGQLMLNEWETGGRENFEAHFTTTNQQISLHLSKNDSVDIVLEFYKRMNRNFVRLEWEVPGSNPIDEAVQVAKESDAVLLFVGLSNFFEGGNNDRKDINLPGDQNNLVSRIAESNPNTIVVLINGSAVSMPWINKVKSVLEAYYSGQEGGNAIANIIAGKVNPSGKLTESFPEKLSDTPTFRSYCKDSVESRYSEGLMVGYRYYQKQKVKPLFPFGHGLSYTQFEYSGLDIKKFRKSIFISFQLKNIGNIAGAEVPQLYIESLGSDSKGFKELKNFDKVFLEAGQSKTVNMEIRKEQLLKFSEIKNKWVKPKGNIEIYIGSSSEDIRLKDSL